MKKLFALVLCFALMSAMCAAHAEWDVESPAYYGALKQFDAKTISGADFTQDDITAKDVTILNFWAVTCGPCVREMPELAAYEKQLPDNVQLVTVCLDASYYPESAASILEEAGFEGVTLVSGNVDLATMCSRIFATPTTLFLNKEGEAVGRVILGAQVSAYDDVLAQVLEAAE